MIMMRSKPFVVVSMLGLASCGQSSPTVRPDEMSASAHRQEARKVGAEADKELKAADARMPQPNLAVSGGGNPEGYIYDRNVYDARNEHLLRARQLREHARQHERAATALEQFENAECRNFPASTRAACPLLGMVARIENIEGGVRVEFERATRVDAVLAHMRCHLAFAAVRGFPSDASCPLYAKGVEIRAGSARTAVEIVSDDPTVAREIQVRSREEAILVEAGNR
jgi:hypothetical protein